MCKCFKTNYGKAMVTKVLKITFFVCKDHVLDYKQNILFLDVLYGYRIWVNMSQQISIGKGMIEKSSKNITN